MNHVIACSVFSDAHSNMPRCQCLPWEMFVRGMTTHRERDTKEGKLWSPAIYPLGATRARKNVTQVCALVADVDHDTDAYSMDLVSNALSSICHIVHTSYSHTQEEPKFRVIVPLEDPISDLDRWDSIWERWRLYFLHLRIKIDRSCSDPSRMYYLPSCPPGAEKIAYLVDGEWMVPNAFLPFAPETFTFIPKREFTHAVETPKPGIILARAIQRCKTNGGREANAFWFCQQMRDNGYSRDDTSEFLRDYHIAVRLLGDHAFSLKEAMGGLSAFSNSPRKPWARSAGYDRTNG